jgi:hypothetical protein
VRGKKKFALALVIAAVAGFLWWRLNPSDERQVAKQVERLAEVVSKRPGETNSVMALKMNVLPGLFADEFTVALVEFPFNGDYTSTVMTSNVARARGALAELELRFYDITAELASETEATALFTAQARVRHKEGKPRVETREMICGLRKVEEKWRFTSFKEEVVLSR